MRLWCICNAALHTRRRVEPPAAPVELEGKYTTLRDLERVSAMSRAASILRSSSSPVPEVSMAFAKSLAAAASARGEQVTPPPWPPYLLRNG